METSKKIVVETTVQAPVEKVWEFWTEPTHITKWNHASDDWHTPHAENDLQTGGKFSSRMEAKNGSFGFDFSGVYDEVKVHEIISFSLEDGRKVDITFTNQGNATKVIEAFDADSSAPIEMQEAGWQAILNNFKRYVENSIEA